MRLWHVRHEPLAKIAALAALYEDFMRKQSDYVANLLFYRIFYVCIIIHGRLNLCSQNCDHERGVDCKIITIKWFVVHKGEGYQQLLVASPYTFMSFVQMV